MNREPSITVRDRIKYVTDSTDDSVRFCEATIALVFWTAIIGLILWLATKGQTI